MRRAKADFYVLKTPAHLLPVMTLFCRCFGKTLGFWAQTSYTSVEQRRTLNKWARLLKRPGVKGAGVVIAQTKEQQRRFAEDFKVEAWLVPSICERFGGGGRPVENPGGDDEVDVLWAENPLANKRPEVFLELARMLPEFRFAMAMNESDRARFSQIKHQAAFLPNLLFLGQVPPAEMEQWFARSQVFVNTSARGGFPNTFLQAWMNGAPVVSLAVDPDRLVQDEMLGLIADPQQVASCGEDPVALAPGVWHLISRYFWRMRRYAMRWASEQNSMYGRTMPLTLWCHDSSLHWSTPDPAASKLASLTRRA